MGEPTVKVGPFPSDHFPSRSQTASSSSLRSGQVVRLVVEGRRGDALLVRIGSRLFSARVQGDVRPGGSYRAEVVGTGRTLVLRTLGRPAERFDVGALVRAHSLPPGTDSEAVVRAFVRSGLPLQAERLALALRRVRSTERLSVAERARLAAVLEDKGLLDVREAWDRAIVGAGGGSPEDGGHERGGDGRDERPRSGERHEDRGEGETDPGGEGGGEREIDGDPGDAPDPAVSAEDVRDAFRTADEPDDMLQLVNHRAGREDAWVLVPIEFGGDVDLSASVRMRLRHPSGEGSAAGRPRFLEAVLDVRSCGRRWTFAIHPSGDSLRVNVLGGPEGGGEATRGDRGEAVRWSELAERLARIGIDFDHSPMSKDSNDGFSTEDSAAIIQSIDSRA